MGHVGAWQRDATPQHAALTPCVAPLHLQVTTRLLCSSSPVLYWYAARKPERCTAFVYWGVVYAVVGVVLFSLGMPWT